MKQVSKEIILGMGLALVVFLAFQGYDITPFIFLGAMLVVLKFMMDSRNGTGRKFEMVGGKKGGTLVIPKVTFGDIGGQEVAKREFQEALTFMKEDKKVRSLGIRPLKGVLLSGPPGTGKTLMAKAAASYTDSVFLTASGSQFVEMYAGVGAQRVRQLFSKARTDAENAGKSSAIIFIDEVDVLGVKRGQNSSHMEYDQTLNELLTQIDGVRVNEKVRILVVAATNRADMLDPALMRPGRFDRIVKVDLPDREGRLSILKIHGKGKPLADDVDLDTVAKETFSFSGAHLESLMNEAAIQALRDGKTKITMAHLREATEKVMLGEKLDRKPSELEKRRIAYHETGHALIGEKTKQGSVSSVTITPRGNALGYMRQNPENDQYLYTRQELLDRIQVCMAGAVAEELVFGERSTGAIGDIDQATNIAKKMVFAGLSKLGVVSQDLPTNLLYEEVAKIIREEEQEVRGYLEANLCQLQLIAADLIENEKLSGEQFRSYLSPVA